MPRPTTRIFPTAAPLFIQHSLQHGMPAEVGQNPSLDYPRRYPWFSGSYGPGHLTSVCVVLQGGSLSQTSPTSPSQSAPARLSPQPGRTGSLRSAPTARRRPRPSSSEIGGGRRSPRPPCVGCVGFGPVDRWRAFGVHSDWGGSGQRDRGTECCPREGGCEIASTQLEQSSFFRFIKPSGLGRRSECCPAGGFFAS